MYIAPWHELSKMEKWLQNENAKANPTKDRRDFEDWMKADIEQKKRKREIKRIAGSEKPRSFNYYLNALRAERKQRQYDDYEDDDYEYEAEQKRRELKWLEHKQYA